MHKNVWCYDEIGNISLVTSQSLITTKIFPIVQLRSLTHFVSLLSAEWSCPIYFRVHINMEAGNSVKQTLSVLSLKAGAQLPQQDFWKILLSL